MRSIADEQMQAAATISPLAKLAGVLGIAAGLMALALLMTGLVSG
jgi:hypothetical protein